MANHAYHSTQRSRKGAMSFFGSRTDIGCVRDQNEDSLVVAPPLYVVADGMGGHEAGEVASEMAVTIIRDLAPAHPDPDALGEAVQSANLEIINAGNNSIDKKGMGTTCTAAMVEGNKLVIAQVGDSRAYLMHKGSLSQLTRDHSYMAELIDKGEITPQEARSHPKRSKITRVLGYDVGMVPDLYEINVEAGDRLLLCSDGLTSMIEDDEIADIMVRHADPQRCAIGLVNAAIAAGGHDNVTTIVVDIEGGAAKAQKKIKRRTKLSLVFILLLLVAVFGFAGWGGYNYLNNTAYLSCNSDGKVEVYRGVPGDVLGFSYSELVESSDVGIDTLSPSAAENIKNNMRVSTVAEALALLENYKEESKKKNEAQQAVNEKNKNKSTDAPQSGSTVSTGAGQTQGRVDSPTPSDATSANVNHAGGGAQ